MEIEKHIVSFSGGKDSTAMLMMMIERGMQIDEIINCDTGMEFPGMYEHIKKVGNYIGREITILKHDYSFEYLMYYKQVVKGRRGGQAGYGWPGFGVRWCTGFLKIKLIDKYLRNKYKDSNIFEYIGIAADEPKRIKDKIYPLYSWGIEEKEALKYCYDLGFDWGGLYEDFKRVSCWCCPLQPLSELRVLRRNYPELWSELLDMDRKAYNQFRPDYSVEQLEERFANEDLQICI